MRPMRLLFPVLPLALTVACDFEFNSPVDPCSESSRIGTLDMVIEPEHEAFDFEFLFPGDTARLSAWVAPVTSGVTSISGRGGCTFFHGNVVATEIVWSSLDPAIATVDQEGRVVARSQGLTSVVARAPALNLERRREVQVALRGQ